MVWHQHLNASWSYTPSRISKHLWTKLLHWKISAAAWRIFTSAKGTKLLMLATIETRLVFRKLERTNPQPVLHAQTKIFMQETRILHIAQALLAMLVERKDIMPNSAQNQGTRPPSRTTVEIIQLPSVTTSTPITITRRVT